MRLIKQSIIFIAFLLILSVSFSLAEADFPFKGLSISGDINVRTDATINSKVICTLDKNDSVEVILELYDWYKIRLPKKARVYIKKNYLECIDFKSEEKNTQCRSATLTHDRVNVRLSPNESSPILGIADKNEIVNINGEYDSWYRIEPIGNSSGWVNKRFIKKAAETYKNQTPPAIKEPPENNIIITGTVKPYGIVFKRLATHKLITGDGKIYLLKGNRVSLNTLINKKVKVIGKEISPLKSKYPVIEIKIIEVVN